MSASAAAAPRYKRLVLLGAGGMAEVWKAKLRGPAGFERTVVVKRILPHRARDPSFVKMFLHEARLSARLTHPNIVQVFELGEEGDEYFMVMEYLHGHDLIAVLRALASQGRRVPTGFAAHVVRDISRALGYAHALCDESGRPLHIVHRDVSPSNVMVGYGGGVKLLDFGIAKALGAGESDVRTETGTLKGKFGYMSPEQVDGRPIDHRSDLFATGTILHELLTGRRLFRASTEFETLTLVRAAKVPPPSSINPEVSPELDAICLKALARDADDRWGSGDQLADALEEHLDGWNGGRLRGLLVELFPGAESTQGSDAEVGYEPSVRAVLAEPSSTETAPEEVVSATAHEVPWSTPKIPVSSWRGRAATVARAALLAAVALTSFGQTPASSTPSAPAPIVNALPAAALVVSPSPTPVPSPSPPPSPSTVPPSTVPPAPRPATVERAAAPAVKRHAGKSTHGKPASRSKVKAFDPEAGLPL